MLGFTHSSRVLGAKRASCMIQVLGFFGCFRSTQPTVQRRGRDLEIAPTEEIKPVSMMIVRCRWFPAMGCAPGVGSLGDEVFDVLGNPARNKIC